MTREAYMKESGIPNGKFICDINGYEGGLLKMTSELMEGNAEHWKEVLGVDSINLMELGRMLMIGGLTEVLGDKYLHYLKEKKGYSPELIKESLETYRKCFAYERRQSRNLGDEDIRLDLVELGHTYVNVFNPNASLLPLELRKVVLGKIKIDVTKWR